MLGAINNVFHFFNFHRLPDNYIHVSRALDEGEIYNNENRGDVIGHLISGY